MRFWYIKTHYFSKAIPSYPPSLSMRKPVSVDIDGHLLCDVGTADGAFVDTRGAALAEAEVFAGEEEHLALLFKAYDALRLVLRW